MLKPQTIYISICIKFFQIIDFLWNWDNRSASIKCLYCRATSWGEYCPPPAHLKLWIWWINFLHALWLVLWNFCSKVLYKHHNSICVTKLRKGSQPKRMNWIDMNVLQIQNSIFCVFYFRLAPAWAAVYTGVNPLSTGWDTLT